MRLIGGGEFRMGSDDHYPEEAPARRVLVDSFWIDETPVTNAAFRRFVEATGYVTLAEIAPLAADYPGADPAMLKAGSLVFVQPQHPVGLGDPLAWWDFRFGANWQRPTGAGSNVQGLDQHPVVHIACADAEAYAAWAGKELPTEAEWEYAARGGLDDATFAWGDTLAPSQQMLANYWQGDFPWHNLALDGYERTSPVRSYPANGYGLYDMIGNVWEWTADWYQAVRPVKAGCCQPGHARGTSEPDSYDPAMPTLRIGRRVMKGGSYLCAENYCQRYRPSARYPQPVDTSTGHLGFRCVRRPGPPARQTRT